MPRKKLEMGNTNFDLLPVVPEGRTLEDAQEDIKDALEEGDSIFCPCCGRFVKAYAKKLSATMVAYLIEFVAAYMRSRDWVDVTTLPAYQTAKQRGDYAALIHWGLLKAKEGEKALFQPTKDGYDFMRGTIQVPTHCFQFNGEIFGFSATMIEVRETLGDKFDYDELMKAVPISRKKIKAVKQ